jgi:hypothetical protein
MVSSGLLRTYSFYAPYAKRKEDRKNKLYKFKENLWLYVTAYLGMKSDNREPGPEMDIMRSDT